MKLNVFKIYKNRNLLIVLISFLSCLLLQIALTKNHKSKKNLTSELNKLSSSLKSKKQNLLNQKNKISLTDSNNNSIEIKRIDLDNKMIEFSSINSQNKKKDLNTIFNNSQQSKIQNSKNIFFFKLNEIAKNKYIESCNFSRTKKPLNNEDYLNMNFYIKNHEDESNNLSNAENKISFKVTWNTELGKNEYLINQFIVLLNYYCMEIKEFQIEKNENNNNKKKQNISENKNSVLNQLNKAIYNFKNEQIIQKKRSVLFEERSDIYNVKNKLEQIINSIKK